MWALPAWPASTRRGVDEELTGRAALSAGITASIYAGFRAAYRTWLEVIGIRRLTDRAQPVQARTKEQLMLERLGERRTIDVHGSALLFVRQVDDFVAAVLDGAPATVSLADSRRSAAALLRAAATPQECSR